MHELLQSIAILVNSVVVLLLVLRNVAESALRRRHLKPGAPGESNVSLAGPKGPAPGARVPPPAKRPEDELCTEPCCNAASWD